jgi:16S rRNA (guanine527-N7)-methyltransferase
MSAVPAAPAAAAAVFGDQLSAAEQYAQVLATAGIERGVIGPREVSRLWERHLLNSAVIAEVIPDGVEVLDVGSGAGLPGVPLALARPDLGMTLVEPLARRVAFLDDVLSALRAVQQFPMSVRVVRARAEALPRAGTDVVVARAVAPLSRLLPMVVPLLRPGGRLVAMKGQHADREVAESAAVLRRLHVADVQVQDVGHGVVIPSTRVVIVDAGR